MQVEGEGAGEGADGKELSARERNQLRRKQRKMKNNAAFAPPPPPVAASGGRNSESGRGGVTVTEQPQDDKGRVVVESVKAAVCILQKLEPLNHENPQPQNPRLKPTSWKAPMLQCVYIR